MIKSLSNIVDISFIEQLGNENDLLPLEKISYYDSEIGSGGFGSVYKIESINGIQTKNYVIKLINHSDSKEHAYNTINLLHNKIKKITTKNTKSIYQTNPELLGLPFIAFRAIDEIEEKSVVGLLMHELVQLKYDDFGSDTFNKNEYAETSIPNRIYYAFQLSKTITFLHKISFIHSDISENAIWINNNKNQIAIIDYDSGFHTDLQEKPTTIGKVGQWIGSRFRNILSKEEDKETLSSEERIQEEYWVLANAIFELIFGVSPYFFINDADDKTKRKYLKENSWPSIDLNAKYFNSNNEKPYKATLSFINQLNDYGLNILTEAFIKVFNKGYKNERQRLKAEEWEKLLSDLCLALDLKPEIKKFTSDKKIIHSNEDVVKLEWEHCKGNLVFINDELINSNYCIKKFDDTTEVTLKVVNDFGEATEKLIVTAKKVNPIIKSFNSNIFNRSDLTPVILSWETENTKLVTLSNFDDKFKSVDSFEVNPLEKTKYILKALGNFNQETEAEIEIDVIGASIKSFRYEINIEKGIDNIDLFWQTENATEASISPRIGNIALNGQTEIGIVEKTDFTINAKGFFNEVSKTIETQPFPIPIIKGILIPTPILNIEMVIPESNLQIPQILNNNLSINFNNSISFKEVIPDFIKLENHIDKIEPIGDKEINSISPTGLFNSLFKKITNK